MPQVDNAVLNGVLCYISTARNSHSDQTILSICLSFFTHDKIIDAKRILFNLTNASITQRRGDGKVKADLLDILAQFKFVDENNVDVPIFVTGSYDSMPPTSGFEVIADHIVHLMEEMSSLKSQINLLTLANSDDKEKDVVDIKEDLHDIKNILLKKEDSMGVNGKNKSFSAAVKDKNSSSQHHPNILKSTSKPQSTSNSKAMPSTSNFKTRKDVYVNDNKDEPQDEGNDGGWHEVSHKRKKDSTIRGLKKTEGAMKGVRNSMDLYVGRCDNLVTSDILVQYIKDETGINDELCMHI